MSVTIKEIAEACNISRGTVDRVLNNRGKVKPETESLVRSTAKRLGYIPNAAGKVLAAQKKKYRIGILLVSEGNQFYDKVIAGIHKAEQEVHSYGVSISLRTMRGYHVNRQLAIIDEMKESINFLILSPIYDERISQKVNELSEEGIKVLTLNTDVANSQRICHIGCNYIKSGEMAAGLMGLFTQGVAKVLIATGSSLISGHNERIEGFKRVCRNRLPSLRIVSIIETCDDDTLAYLRTREMLLEHKDITAIYIVAAGTIGVCNAVKEMDRQHTIAVIASDQIKETRDLIDEGIIKATICQQPFTQGYKAVHMAFQYLIHGTLPTKDLYMVKNEIKIYENMED